MKVKELIRNKTFRYCLCGAALLVLIALLCFISYRLGVSNGGKGNARASVSEPDAKSAQTDVSETPAVSETAVTITSAGVNATADAIAVSVNAALDQAREANRSKNSGVHHEAVSDNQFTAGGQSASAAVSSGSAEGGAGAPPSYAGKLKVVGNRLCTADGTPIQLRGVSTHGLSWFPEYVNLAMFGEIKNWGANTVRLAMYTEEYNGYCSGDESNRRKLKEVVKKGVSFAQEQGLYVIIDWHILSDGNPNRHKAEAEAFFAEMADLYKDNDHVIYEICNEPNGGVSWSEIKSYAMEIIAAIRARDPDGVILVGTPTWSQAVDKAAADPITGYDNIMYTLHFYADTHRDSLRNTLVSAIKGGLPVFVSEFGVCDASGNGAINSAQADLWMQTLNQYGVSYVAWNLSNKAETCALISSGCSKVNGITEADLSESGRWLLKTLQGSASSDASASSNQAAQDQSVHQAQNAQTENNQAANQNDSNAWQQQKSPQQYTPSPSGGVEVAVVTSWQEGNAFCIQYEIKVSNTGAANVESWSGSLTFPVNAQVVSGWNANFSAQGQTVTFTNMDYNKTIAPGGKAEGIGCIVRFE